MSTPRPDRALARSIQRVTATALGPYQTAVVRIGFGATFLAFLLRELPHRHEMYGPDAPWRWDVARQLISGNQAFTVLMWSDNSFWFEVVYALAMLSSLLLMLGWHTRATSVLFMAGVLSLQNRNIFMGDGGDNVIHLMALYLVLTRCGQVWSLDARRARRHARDAARGVDDVARSVEDVARGVQNATESADEAAVADREPAARRAPGELAGIVLWAVLGCVLVVATAAGGLGEPCGCRFFCGACGWGRPRGGPPTATRRPASPARSSTSSPTSPTTPPSS